jgi:hypothetical protein
VNVGEVVMHEVQRDSGPSAQSLAAGRSNSF